MTVVVDGTEHRFVSVDDHVVEHPGVWEERVPAGLAGRAPRVEEVDGGRQVWVVDGRPVDLVPRAAVGALLGDPVPHRWPVVPRAAWDPAARLAAMDDDGVDASVLYPTVAGLAGEALGRLADPELEQACVRAWNDWLVEEWAAASDRFVPQCLLPLWPPEAAVAELERAVGLGHRGVVYPALPSSLRDVPDVGDPGYGRLWDADAAAGVPVAFHAGGAPQLQAPPWAGFPPEVADAFESVTRPFSSALVMANYLLSQLLVPHPDLMVVFAEDSVGWGAFTLETMDYLVQVDRLNVDTYPLLPSEVFARQCHLVGSYEPVRPDRDGKVRPERVLWATNFPLGTSTWPASGEAVAAALAPLPADERHLVLSANAERLYGA
jgi:predicted TIM-barrel fold metal-dependent hydrolase